MSCFNVESFHKKLLAIATTSAVSTLFQSSYAAEEAQKPATIPQGREVLLATDFIVGGDNEDDRVHLKSTGDISDINLLPAENRPAYTIEQSGGSIGSIKGASGKGDHFIANDTKVTGRLANIDNVTFNGTNIYQGDQIQSSGLVNVKDNLHFPADSLTIVSGSQSDEAGKVEQIKPTFRIQKGATVNVLSGLKVDGNFWQDGRLVLTGNDPDSLRLLPLADAAREPVVSARNIVIGSDAELIFDRSIIEDPNSGQQYLLMEASESDINQPVNIGAGIVPESEYHYEVVVDPDNRKRMLLIPINQADQSAELIADLAAGPNSDLTANPETDPAANPVTDLVASSAANTVANPVTDQVANPATDLVAYPAANPVSDPAADPVADSLQTMMLAVTNPTDGDETEPPDSDSDSAQLIMPVANTAADGSKAIKLTPTISPHGIHNATLALRTAGKTLDERMSGKRIGVSAGDIFSSGGAWIQYAYSKATQDTKFDVPGYHAKINGVSIGADSLLEADQNTTVGVAYTYANGNVEGVGGQGGAGNKIDTDTNIFSLYSSYTEDDFFFDGRMSYSFGKNKGHRYVGGNQLSAKYDSQSWGIGLIAGYTYPMGDQWSWQPRVAFNYYTVKTDDYSESARDPAQTYLSYDQVNNGKYDIMELGAGLTLTGDINTDTMVIQPQLGLMGFHDFKKDPIAITAHYASGGESFLINGADREANRYQLDATIHMEIQSNTTIAFSYSHYWSDSYRVDGFLARVRYTF